MRLNRIPQTPTQLRANILLNHKATHIHAHELAVGDHEGVVKFKMLGNGGSSLNAEDSRHGYVKEVSMVTIDGFLGHLKDKKIAVKIDVEVYELEVITGMKQFLRDNDCFLQIERFEGQTPKSLDGVLQDLGYGETHRIGDDSYYEKRASL